jgi:hypothetical protein
MIMKKISNNNKEHKPTTYNYNQLQYSCLLSRKPIVVMALFYLLFKKSINYVAVVAVVAVVGKTYIPLR